MSTPHVVVVGASLGGLRAAEQLRARGFEGRVTVIGDERHLPYNRPPLSKEVLADPGDNDPARLHGRVEFRRKASTADVDFVLGVPVVGSDLARRELRLESGEVVPYDGLVVATGLRPRRLDLPGPEQGRHSIRTLDDCVGLRTELATLTGFTGLTELTGLNEASTAGRRPSVVVVGAGFIGCETAATLVKRGCDVTVVEPFGAPMERVLGADLAGAVQRHHERAGVRFVLGASPAAYTDGAAAPGRVGGLLLADGRVLPADLVVESVGSVCNTGWLAGNDLDLRDGVLADNDLRVVGAEGVVAVGDVARFPNPLFDDVPRRVEHWSIPTDTARRAATTLLAELTGSAVDPAPFAPIPSFWSDQHDLRLQSFGSPGLADEARLVEGDVDRLADGVLVTYHRLGAHVGTIAVNLPPARQRELRDDFVARVPAVAIPA
ncbi:NAD/ferredoxin-dependent reductase-like protein [Humibacillus xanthopallidus]|uniref:NAD/ferredoxin-dependent reductase-like protein n=1 Tax=Humibacillus xanthopallidus TaxID=412689 RepID=A0A543PQB8_9MICO|nr:FAD-dependent oxidoreductase [Humibacillus xanthopallidus]TQN46264.1 NAD/ferredoxin-dependent reductase-like protein [Humibacillus xanthopallidus]